MTRDELRDALARMTEDDIIRALGLRAEGGDNQAKVRLHKMHAAGIDHPDLAPYAEWPRDKAGRQISTRARGRPSGNPHPDRAIERSDNTGIADLRNWPANVQWVRLF